MMVRTLVLALLPLVACVVVSGCSTSAVGERDQAYADYYALMTDEQRTDFASLRLLEDREAFIQMHGLDVAHRLNQDLRVGMSFDQVRGILGDPWNVEEHDVAWGPKKGHYVSWFYRKFDGVAHKVVSSVRFHSGKVEGWGAWRAK